MFNSDPTLFYSAQQSIIDAYDMLKNKRTNINEVKTYPTGFEYKSEIEEVCKSIESIISNIAKLERKTSETKDKLVSLDNAFAIAYYGCASSKYDSLDGRLTNYEKNYVNYSQEQYAKKLYQYLDDLNSKGQLPDEYKETYKILKSNVDLSNKVNELTKLQSNPVVPPKALSQRPNQQEMKEYTKQLQKYTEYQNKIKALEKDIKSIQKENGTYQNKWYEDLGEAFTKTGSAWGKAFKSGKLSDFADAYSQTKATGAVIKTSCVSGVIKLGEWTTDGIVAINGTIKSCEDWGATLLTTFDINKANKSFSNTMDKTLDYVRIDWTKKLNDWFYQDTEIGREINAKSNLKYDSAGATAIQNGSRYAVEFGICCIPGMQWAAPVILGLEGAGKSVELYTQTVDREHGESYNYGCAVLKETTGFLSGYAQGKANVAFGGAIKNFSAIKSGASVLKGTTFRSVISEAKDGGINLLKTTLSKTAKDFDTWSDLGCIISDDVQNGLETGKWNLLKMGIDAVKSFGANFLFSYSGGMLEKIISDNCMDSSVANFYKNSDNCDDYWGANQDIASRYKRTEIVDKEWLEKNKKNIISILSTEHNLTLKDAEDCIERWKINGVNDFTKKVLEKYIYSSSKDLDDSINKIENIFKEKLNPEYLRLQQILKNKGLSDVESIKVLDSMEQNIGCCTYASASNAIFSQFDGKEELFKKTFGFDMFEEIDGKMRLNSNELILDMYCYLNSEEAGGSLFSINNSNMSLLDINTQRKRANNSKALNQYFKSKDSNLNLNLQEKYDGFEVTDKISKEIFKEKFNIDFNSGNSYRLDLIAGNYVFMKTPPIKYYDENGNILLNMVNGGHSVFITDITDEAIECSSWGKKCYIKLDNLKGVSSVQVRTMKLGE